MYVRQQEDVDSRLAREFRNGTFGSKSVEYFLERVVRILKSIGRFERRNAEDIALATLEEVWNSIHTYRGESAFFTWVTAIARRVSYDYHNRDGKIRIISMEMSHTGLPIESDATYLERFLHEMQVREMQEEEVRLRVRDALNLLGESERRLVELRIYRDLSLSEIGELLGASSDAIQHRLARIWPKLRIYLDDNEVLDSEKCSR